MSRLRNPYLQAARMTRFNDAPIHSPGCVDEMQRLMEFLQKRLPPQRAGHAQTTDADSYYALTAES